MPRVRDFMFDVMHMRGYIALRRRDIWARASDRDVRFAVGLIWIRHVP